MRLKRSPIGSGIAALLVGFFLAATLPAGAKEGFGSSKNYVRMERVAPASFAVRTVGEGAGGPFGRQLAAELEKELASPGSGLVAGPAEPQIRIELTVLRNQLADRWETKVERERRQIGIGVNGQSRFQAVEVEARFQVIAYDVAVSFEILEAGTGAFLGSGTVEVPFEGRFRDGAKAPAAAKLEKDAIGKVVGGIAGRITQVRAPIAVPLPEGRLEALIALARAGQWESYRAAAAALAPSPDPQDEAYRQYALAAANEALAYAAAGESDRAEYLKLAENQYQAAIAAHPGEPMFTRKIEATDRTAAVAAPLERVRAALAALRPSETASLPVAPAPAVAAPASRAAGGGGAMDNAAVIRLVREGSGGYAILKAIKAAPELAFDFSPEGLAELAAAEVDPKIIGYMQQYSVQE